MRSTAIYGVFFYPFRFDFLTHVLVVLLGGNEENSEKNLRFVQLYTSKSYEDRRSMLVKPAEEEEEENALVTDSDSMRNSTDDNLNKHVLSPLLVDAISKTAQVVWAHTKKQEGLLGRSDIRLQTAVGMPVAVDGNGNMCVVVMFSPNNIQSTDDAMEYLQSISKGATSTSIPSLLPAFDPKQGLISIPHHTPSNEMTSLLASPHLSDGVTTRFVSLDESLIPSETLSMPEVHSDHDLASAPKDCFGIPMLPSNSEIAGTSKDFGGVAVSDAFDEASYGIWSTIMDTEASSAGRNSTIYNGSSMQNNGITDSTPLYTVNKPEMPRERRERLEEFASAFLEVSVFDFAEVWIPVGGQSEFLGQVTSITSSNFNPLLDDFIQKGEKILIKNWSGAVGRAFASSNPVWSSNRDVFVDSGRSELFDRVNIETVLAVPVFSGKSTTPSIIFSCYSLVRSGTVPFVLKFVQQAMRLLWSGLDKVQPHASVGDQIWKDLEPADLGEMAADVEMQQLFMEKKRPHHAISDIEGTERNTDPSLADQFENMDTPSGVPTVRSIYTGSSSSPDFASTSPPSVPQVSDEVSHFQYQTFENIQGHIQDAIRSIGEMRPVHQHIATNDQGSKRAHVFMPVASQQQYYEETNLSKDVGPSSLPLPRPLLPPHQVLANPNTSSTRASRYTQEVQYQSQSNKMAQNHSLIPNQSSQNQQAGLPSKFNYPSPTPTNTQIISPFSLELSQSTNGMAAIPKNQISATGISFPIPPNPQMATPTGMPTSSVSLNSPQFCMPARQDAAPKKRDGKPCRIQGCDEPSVERRPYCVRHSGNRMCEHEGCSKCAQGATRFCIAHGGGRRCTFPNCDKGARDKFFCAAHGGGKRCKFEGCKKSAVGGSSLCTAHGGGRRCSVEGCDKSAQSSTRFCVKHGGGKKCSHAGCEKVARGRTQFCAAHGGGIRCKLEGCTRVAIGKFQLCRAHGGGVRAKGKNPPPLSAQGVPVYMAGSL